MPLNDVTLDHLWSSLKEEEISQGCVALFKPCHQALDKRMTAAMHRIAEIRNIRINSIRANSPEKNAAIFLKFVRSKNHSDFWDDIIQAFLLGPQLSVVSAFLEAILDQMECIARTNSQFRLRFLKLLEDSDKFSLVWTPQEVSYTIIDLYERAGNLPQAISLLCNLFHEVRADSDERGKKVELQNILEWLTFLNADSKIIADLQDLAFGEDASSEAVEIVETPVTLLYIGGNETQRQYEAAIRAELEESHPAWALEFYFPGWTSNWNVHLNNVRPKISASDAVILSNLIRTQFGRHVRKTCDQSTPWFPCTGRGRESLKRSIKEAGRWAASRKKVELN